MSKSRRFEAFKFVTVIDLNDAVSRFKFCIDDLARFKAIFTHAESSRGDRVFTDVCIFQTIFQKQMQL